MSRRSRKRARTKVSMYRRDMPLSASRIDGRRRYFSESREYRSRPYQAPAWTPRYKLSIPTKPPLPYSLVVPGSNISTNWSSIEPMGFGQKDIRRAVVCIRRVVRKQVLFANRVAGRSGRSPGKHGTYRRNEGSNIICSKR